MSSRETIRAVATDNGWTSADNYHFGQEFVRDVEPSETLKRMQAAGNVSWQAKERVFVRFSVNGNVLFGSFSTPSQQSILTGQFVGFKKTAEGPGKKVQIIEWLTSEKGALA